MREWQQKLEGLRASLHVLEEDVNDEQVAVYMAAVLRSYQGLHESEQRYRLFIENSSDGIWHAEVDGRIDTASPPQEQVDAMFAHVVMAECNPAMARMYGYENPGELAGVRLSALMPRDDPRNRDYLLAFIRSNYLLIDAESFEVDRHGKPKRFLNSLVGRVESGRVVSAWGSQRESASAPSTARIQLKPVERLDRVLNDDRIPADLRAQLDELRREIAAQAKLVQELRDVTGEE